MSMLQCNISRRPVIVRERGGKPLRCSIGDSGTTLGYVSDITMVIAVLEGRPKPKRQIAWIGKWPSMLRRHSGLEKQAGDLGRQLH